MEEIIPDFSKEVVQDNWAQLLPKINNLSRKEANSRGSIRELLSSQDKEIATLEEAVGMFCVMIRICVFLYVKIYYYSQYHQRVIL